MARVWIPFDKIDLFILQIYELNSAADIENVVAMAKLCVVNYSVKNRFALDKASTRCVKSETIRIVHHHAFIMVSLQASLLFIVHWIKYSTITAAGNFFHRFFSVLPSVRLSQFRVLKYRNRRTKTSLNSAAEDSCKLSICCAVIGGGFFCNCLISEFEYNCVESKLTL